MIDKHAILAGLVAKKDALVRVQEVDMETKIGDISEEGGVVGILAFDEEKQRYYVMDLDEDPNVVIVKILFPIEKFLGAFNFRYQPLITILK